MSDAIARSFLEESRAFLAREYLPKIRVAIAALDDEAIWWRANAPSNSIGNLMLHLSGNARQWIVCGIGGADDTRVRLTEFTRRDGIPRDELLATLSRTLEEVDEVLARVTPEQLLEPRTIQGRAVTVLEAIYHVVEHFSTHTGQIILLAKMHAAGVRFYDDSTGDAKPLWPQARR